ncbi:hypothetical protein BKA65DRAFT_255839 [Rhexocercosporidium sp. MPI-PUGE-AT-0058]|nr:hypothetical protein BKA65DRAFT_255839 [Rhexocercosporidium sp. MPI-PUGE-AT-0058]
MASQATFHSFPKLPPELRLKIWDLAEPEQEIIKVGPSYFKGEGQNTTLSCRGKRHLLVSARAVPGLFHVCLESRQISVARYTRGFESDCLDGDEEVQCSHLRQVTTAVKGKKRWAPKREVYWRPEIDIVLVEHMPTYYEDDGHWSAASVLFESEAPCGGLQSYGVQHVILQVMFFFHPHWDPRLCEYTWGMETVYVILIRKTEDTPAEWEEHLAWFGRSWLRVTSDWREVVGEDAILEERVPFIPKVVELFEGESLQSKHLDEAKDCVLVEESETDAEVQERIQYDDYVFRLRRYGGMTIG